MTSSLASRDGLGTTHHEAGTLWMGTDPAPSVTTPDTRFHGVVNAYALGPAVLPTVGSPGPMLSGSPWPAASAITSRLRRPRRSSRRASHGSSTAPRELRRWLQAGPGEMLLDEDERIVTARPGNDIGLWFFGDRGFADFVLRLQFCIDAPHDNTGVFVRFTIHGRRRPTRATPECMRTRHGPPSAAASRSKSTTPRDDGSAGRRTGALYDVATTGRPGPEPPRLALALRPGAWNDYEITVTGDSYAVRLNGHVTSVFNNATPTRASVPPRTPRRASSACNSTPATSPSEPCAISNRPAAPWPPPMHIVTTPHLAPRRLPSCRMWPAQRAPVMPKGWPMAIEPPLTLYFAGSMPSLSRE